MKFQLIVFIDKNNNLLYFWGTLTGLLLQQSSDREIFNSLNIKVESIDSALVGLSDIAELTGLTRQAVALLKDGARGKGHFPAPVQRLNGASPLWDLASVAHWLQQNNRLSHNPELYEQAKTLCKWNLVLRNCANEYIDELQKLTSKLAKQRKQKRLTEVNR
ncbi:hypothetical protein [Providencia rettgeri]|uniref:helix-turn-helix transcriptional regulator n=1 Tax=Providencia TaxID=586 RepID=UPI0029D84C98|nr:hypothetical protein [Providencia rettgeri]MDX7321267.1 hypothetical protein [Providencia rettgeri]